MYQPQKPAQLHKNSNALNKNALDDRLLPASNATEEEYRRQVNSLQATVAITQANIKVEREQHEKIHLNYLTLNREWSSKLALAKENYAKELANIQERMNEVRASDKARIDDQKRQIDNLERMLDEQKANNQSLKEEVNSAVRKSGSLRKQMKELEKNFEIEVSTKEIKFGQDLRDRMEQLQAAEEKTKEMERFVEKELKEKEAEKMELQLSRERLILINSLLQKEIAIRCGDLAQKTLLVQGLETKLFHYEHALNWFTQRHPNHEEKKQVASESTNITLQNEIPTNKLEQQPQEAEPPQGDVPKVTESQTSIKATETPTSAKTTKKKKETPKAKNKAMERTAEEGKEHLERAGWQETLSPEGVISMHPRKVNNKLDNIKRKINYSPQKGHAKKGDELDDEDDIAYDENACA